MQRLVVGISGASGMPLAYTLLHALRQVPRVEIHLIVSEGAREVLQAEGRVDTPPALDTLHWQEPHSVPAVDQVDAGAHNADPLHALISLAHVLHDPRDTGAAPASGSWQHSGMIVCPCSMSTLASIATGAGQNLLHRAADVTLKERRPLVLIPRETPLSRIHLRNMLTAQEAGAVIMPFCPAFYGQPSSMQDLLDHMAGRILDQLSLPHQLGHRWQGSPSPTTP